MGVAWTLDENRVGGGSRQRRAKAEKSSSRGSKSNGFESRSVLSLATICFIGWLAKSPIQGRADDSYILLTLKRGTKAEAHVMLILQLSPDH